MPDGLNRYIEYEFPDKDNVYAVPVVPEFEFANGIRTLCELINVAPTD